MTITSIKVNFAMLTTFSFGVSSNLSQQKSPTAEIITKNHFTYELQIQHFQFFEEIAKMIRNNKNIIQIYFRTWNII